MGLGGTITHGGFGHYGWFDLSTSDVDSSEHTHQVKGLLNIEYRSPRKTLTTPIATLAPTLLPVEEDIPSQEPTDILTEDITENQTPFPTRTHEASQVSLPLVGVDTIWSDDAGRKILLVNLDAISAKSIKRKMRMNAITYMARQADQVFIAGQRKMVEDARPHLAEFGKRAEMIETGSAGITKYLLRAARKASRSGSVQFAITSNEHAFSELAKLGRITIISPNVSCISKQLLSLSGAVLDIQSLSGEAEKFTPVPKVYVPSVVLPKVSIDAIWHPDAGQRVFLVDLDNLVTQKACFALRMEAIVTIARSSDHVFIAGQKLNVNKALPYLAEFADSVVAVRLGPDVADKHLLAATKSVRAHGCAQFAVSSNDHIFSKLGNRGRLTIVSPHIDTIAEDLLKEAVAVFDLRDVEGEVRQPSFPRRGSAHRKALREQKRVRGETKEKLSQNKKSIPAPIASEDAIEPKVLPDIPQFIWTPFSSGSKRKDSKSSTPRRLKPKTNPRISGERRAELEQARAIADRLEIQTLAI
jgi:hypothetical protein